MAPRGFRITNLLLHLACGALVFALLRRAAPIGAAAGTALFLLHPLQAESIIYIWGRSGLLATLFGLAALLVALPEAPGGARDAAAPGRSGRAGARTWGRRVAAWSLAALALASKEEAIILPLVAFLYARFAARRTTAGAARTAALLALPIVLFLALRPLVLGAVGRQVFARSVPDNVLGQALVTLRMTALTLLPRGLSIDHPAVVPPAGLGLAAVALCAVVALAASAVAIRATSGAWSTTGAGILIFAAAWMLYWIVPLPDLMSERRAYLPLFGAALALAGLVEAFAARLAAGGRAGGLPARTALVAAIAPALLLAVPLHAALRGRAHLWAAPERLWEEAARQAPWRARPEINLGVIAAGRGDLEAAARHFDSAVAAEPRNPEALYNRGKLRLDAGEHAAAEADLAASIAADPTVPRVLINHAVALIRLGRIDEAARDLERAIAIDPGDPRALTNYAEVVRAAGRTGDALALYRRALASDPGYAHAAVRLGVALEGSGDPQGAIEAYREYLRRGPASPADAAAARSRIEALEATLAAPGSIR